MKTLYQFLYTYCILQGTYCIAVEEEVKEKVHWSDQILNIRVPAKELPRSGKTYPLTPPTNHGRAGNKCWVQDKRRRWSFSDESSGSSEAGEGLGNTFEKCPNSLNTKASQVLAGYGAYPSSSAESSRAPSPSKRQSPIPWPSLELLPPIQYAGLEHSNSSRSSSPFKRNTTRPALPFPSSCDTSRAPSPNGAHSGASSTQPSPQVSPRKRALIQAIIFPTKRNARRFSGILEEETPTQGSQAGYQRPPLSTFGGSYRGRRHSQ